MNTEELQLKRRGRLEAAAEKAGGKAQLGRLLGYKDGAYIGQMLRGERPIKEDTVLKLESKPGFRGWFTQMADGPGYPLSGSGGEPVNDAANIAHGDPALSYSGRPQFFGVAPVVTIARVDDEGFFQEERFHQNAGGWVPSLGPNATFALLVKGDGLAPVYESGQYLLIAPGAAALPGGRVLITFTDGRQSIRKLMVQRADEVVVTGVIKAVLQTIETRDIASIDPVVAVIEANLWMAELPDQQADSGVDATAVPSTHPPPAPPSAKSAPASRYVKSQNMGATAKKPGTSKRRSA